MGRGAEGFRLFGLIILPVVLFLGIATVVRLGASNYHDAICVIGMNRIRAGDLEMAPELERYFVMGRHDDVRGVGVTMAIPVGGSTLWHVLAATPSVVGVVDSVLVGAIAALAALQLGAGSVLGLMIAIIGFVGSMAAHAAYRRRQVSRRQAALQPMFPTPASTPEEEPPRSPS